MIARRRIGESLPNFQNSTGDLACLPAPQILKFEREDWTSFRTVEGLQQKAGVPKNKLTRLVLKELADNGLDAGANVKVGELPKGGYFVEDDGPGIDGSPEDIARLFSIKRPMVSTKLLRLPQRGALGNGLRVVAGAVLASGGTLVVITRNKRITLRPERDGSTCVVGDKPAKRPAATRIEIKFGRALPKDANALLWAKIACRFAQTGSSYAGKSSPHWYDVAQFHELLSASGDTPVRELVAQLDGCTGGKAGEIVATAGLSRAICRNVTAKQAAHLLEVAQANAKPVNAKRLGAVGPGLFYSYAYACVQSTVELGSGEIPFVIEAWATAIEDGVETHLTVCVNRTPVTGDIHASRDGRDIDVFGCGLSDNVARAPKECQFDIWLNIITPFMPITSDGKEPDLNPFFNVIATAIGKTVRKAHRPNSGGVSQKDVVLDNLDDVLAEVSGDGEFRFNARQLFYGLRPIVMQETGEELKIGNFTGIITDYEDEFGEIEGMYREPRGSITHPHRKETITLGTLMVEEYERPEWTFNKLAYIEKEGANEALKDNGWLERHDCALMSSKGFSTRAARDLIDKLAEHDEPITVYAVTDADAYGSMIQQTLQEATKARGARKINIINLGLYPWEAIAMGLEVETVKPKENKNGEPQRKPVADFVKAADASGEHGTAPNGDPWEEWLQTHRVELNAMTTPQFIAWLDGKMAAHAKETKQPDKLVPPEEVIAAELEQRIESKMRARVTERILREARVEDQIATALRTIKRPSGASLVKGIWQLFRHKPESEWRAHVEAVAIERTAAARAVSPHVRSENKK
jgi:hypothetical protein